MILKDKVAIVTGAGSGIGRAGAEIMAREGALLVVFDRNGDAAAETARLIRDAGGRAEAVAVDVTDEEALTREIAGTMARHGRIDILHNHAGVQVEGTLEQVPPEGFDRSWDLNVRAHFVAARIDNDYELQQADIFVDQAKQHGIDVFMTPSTDNLTLRKAG